MGNHWFEILPVNKNCDNAMVSFFFVKAACRLSNYFVSQYFLISVLIRKCEKHLPNVQKESIKLSVTQINHFIKHFLSSIHKWNWQQIYKNKTNASWQCNIAPGPFHTFLMGLWYEIGQDCFSWIPNGLQMEIGVN